MCCRADGDLQMNRSLVVLLAILLMTVPLYAEEKLSLSTDKDKVNYSIGVYLVNMLRQQGVNFDPELVLKGFNDAMTGKGLLLTEDEINTSVKTYQRAVRQKQAGKLKHSPAADNLKVGEKFLAENKAKPGVMQTDSGLQYRIIKQGDGRIPAATDNVEYSYKSFLLNRKEIASSVKSGRTEVAQIGGELLPALKEAFLLMKVGSKWEIYIPAHLAYGETGKGHEVPPNSALIYEVELLAIK